MSLSLLDLGLQNDIDQLVTEGRAKAPERVIVDYIPASGLRGPRYKLAGAGDQEDRKSVV